MTEELKIIVEMMNNLTEGALTAFIVYLVVQFCMKLGITALIMFPVYHAIKVIANAILGGVRSNDFAVRIAKRMKVNTTYNAQPTAKGYLQMEEKINGWIVRELKEHEETMAAHRREAAL